jgi:ADP-heptose:LPS heptosyltransferase
VTRRILLIHTEGGLGDVLLSSPIALALKRQWPDATITAWVRQDAWPLFDGSDCFDEPLMVDGSGFPAEWRALRRGRFDVAVLPWSTGRQAALAWLAGIGTRVGQARRLAYSWMFTHRVDVESARRNTTRHCVEIQLGYARALGCPTDGLWPRLVVSDAEIRAAGEWLAARAVDPGRPVCSLHVGKGLRLTFDRWPVAGFVRVGRGLVEAGFQVVLTGSAAERPIVDRVSQDIGPGAASIAGETNLRTLAAILGRMAVVVGPDAGPGHIAAALGVPVVAIFAVKSDLVSRWRPWSVRSRVVTTAPWVCPKRCVKEACARFDCLEAFDAGAVVRAALDVFQGRSRED